MCGIGGLFLKAGHDALDIKKCLYEMLDIQHHRGPDSNDFWLADNQQIGLCHTRLAILDLTAAGNQPMRSADGRYTIVFNGEVYNHQEIRKVLIERGALFNSHTDTEVLIEAYRLWGEEMLHKLRGMFAFSIYDSYEAKLFCARDQVGKKPFVYAQTSSAFVFASEIPAIKFISGVDTRYDHSAISAMFLHNLRHIPDPNTAYRGIKKLKPGHAMTVQGGQIQKIWRYWEPTPYSENVTSQRLREILEESVGLRMQADVPVGALLSGGVDSTAIVALMQRNSTVPIHTYALGFDSHDEDLKRARSVASALGTTHREFYFEPERQWETFNSLINIYGEPIMLLPLVHTYALSHAIREDGIKVVLTGNGADELFYGYTGHIRTLKISRLLDGIEFASPCLAPLASTRLGWLAAKPGERKATWYRGIAHREWNGLWTENAKKYLVNIAADEFAYWGGLCPSRHYIDESNFVGLMVENSASVTTVGDLPAMAASVEFRAPFLDQEIISFALATPANLKIPDTTNKSWLKAILRDAVKDLMPESILKAPKRGFGMGIQESDLLRGSWRERAQDVFYSARDADGLVDVGNVKKAWKRYLSGKGNTNQIAKMLALQLWLQKE